MPKGRPSVYEPRIAALELKIKILDTELRALTNRVLALEHPQGIPAAREAYKPLFEHWPNTTVPLPTESPK